LTSAAAARDHERQHRAAGDDRGGEVERHHALPLRQGRGQEVAAREPAGRVDEAVDPAEPVAHRLDELAHRVLARDVGGQGEQARAQPGGQARFEPPELVGHRVGNGHRPARLE
jgi:hypothetical protein